MYEDIQPFPEDISFPLFAFSIRRFVRRLFFQLPLLYT
jgi:hypothetical protein